MDFSLLGDLFSTLALMIHLFSPAHSDKPTKDPALLVQEDYAIRLLICREEFTQRIKIHGPDQEETDNQLEKSCRKIARGRDLDMADNEYSIDD